MNIENRSRASHSTGGPLIRLCDVEKVYPSAANPVLALKNINAEIQEGEFIGVLGKSGAGKSTLVNMISGLDRLTSGEIWVADVPVHDLSEDKAASWRGRNLGIIYQTFQLMPTISVLRNITLAMDFNGLYRGKGSDEMALELLRQVEIEEHAFKHPSAVSGGQQQRVAIARALANDPPILLADEPTGRLDTGTAETIMQIFEKLVEQGKTIIMVTHDMSLADRFSRLIWLADGEFVDEPQLIKEEEIIH